LHHLGFELVSRRRAKDGYDFLYGPWHLFLKGVMVQPGIWYTDKYGESAAGRHKKR
jgi:hypothetical protein